MKFIASLLLTALLAFIGGIYLPWWSIAIATFIAALLIHQTAGKAFVAGFLGVFIVWALLAWLIDNANQSLLSGRIGELLGIGNNSLLLIGITALIGGLVGGFAALSASFVRSTKK